MLRGSVMGGEMLMEEGGFFDKFALNECQAQISQRAKGSTAESLFLDGVGETQTHIREYGYLGCWMEEYPGNLVYKTQKIEKFAQEQFCAKLSTTAAKSGAE